MDLSRVLEGGEGGAGGALRGASGVAWHEACKGYRAWKLEGFCIVVTTHAMLAAIPALVEKIASNMKLRAKTQPNTPNPRTII